ncbi:hypothetical protein EYC98_08420 [Halieaceae bacterium IMCC14734]|uniref:Transporter n=1 Tax=Candidatus Litorirhabdus singularis TaxID=2518993 RepID=A0ABT3TF02_9GAMM|nr:hypothetical protein [Candidatus Litorirhabdus singularis]MCX2980887.1 hypothetical protein [Candidatus Litorirhabdus singularis]
MVRLTIATAMVLTNSATWSEENPSNPLSKGKNTDLRIQHFDLKGGNQYTDFIADGAFMATEKLKVKYELHYANTDVTGKSEQDFNTFHLKGIYFPKEGVLGSTPYRLAVGLEWITSFDNADKGIGINADVLSPFAGIALQVSKDLMLIPLVQHYTEYSGDDVEVTAGRLIGLWSLDNGYWGKLDAKAPYDWDSETLPASAEVQFGRMLSPSFGLYVEGLVGVGDDRSYDWGAGLGFRFVY